MENFKFALKIKKMPPSTLSLAAFFLFAIVLYSNALDGPFIFDDERNIQYNAAIQIQSLKLSSILGAAFNSALPTRPVANISFALNHYFFGLDPLFFRLVNILIHIVSAFFLFQILRWTLEIAAVVDIDANKASVIRKVSERRKMTNRNDQMAFFGSLLWLVHPVQTQSVTYIVQRMNSLSSMFYLASLYFFIRLRLQKKGRKKDLWLLACIVSGFLALGSKEIAFTLPVVLLLYEFCFFRDFSAAQLRKIVVAAVIGAGAFSLFILALSRYHDATSEGLFAGYMLYDYGMYERILTESRVILHYIGLLLYPHPSRLNLDYDFAVSRALFSPASTFFSVAFIIGVLAFAVFRLKKNKLVGFCILWFFINLAIESTILPLDLVFEHRLYLPSATAIFLLAYALFVLVENKRVLFVLLGCVVVLFSSWTYLRNAVWADKVVFWEDCVTKSPSKARPHAELARAYYERGDMENAEKNFEQSLRLDPGFEPALFWRGVLYKELGRYDQAVEYFLRAARQKDSSPETFLNIGSIYYAQKKYSRAIDYFRKAARLAPGNPPVYNRIGACFVGMKKYRKALFFFYEASRLNPGNPDYRNNISALLNVLQKDNSSDKEPTKPERPQN